MKLTSSMLIWGCGRTTKTARPCEMVASPVTWRICAAISLRKAAFEKAQGAATAVIATDSRDPRERKLLATDVCGTAGRDQK